MTLGRAYVWTPESEHPLGGVASVTRVPLENLDAAVGGTPRLVGKYVRVRNGGIVNMPDPTVTRPVATPIGDAKPDRDGNFFFEQGRGGGRIDKVVLAAPDFRWRYVQASHFGEVNVYFHVDRIARYVHELLGELLVLGAERLPRVTAVVNAHHGAVDLDDRGNRDGVRGPHRWLPFQGAHYRLPGKAGALPERDAIAPEGEIHFGPGFELAHHGALVQAARDRYRANASHNPGIIYHEYAHHVTRYTADFRANALRRAAHQDNRKTALDEGSADYFAATMLQTPHIWAFHHRHDAHQAHPRSLSSRKTMADFDPRPEADPHANGTIWACALWDLRTALSREHAGGSRLADRLLLAALLVLGRKTGALPACEKGVRRARRGFVAGLRALLEADEITNDGVHRRAILEAFRGRGIVDDANVTEGRSQCPVVPR